MPSAIERAAAAPALEFDNLRVAYKVRGVDREVLHGLNLRIGRGEAYGLVGESGCGKSTAALAAMRYLPRNGRLVSGAVRIDGRDLYRLSSGDLRRLRADVVSMVYQDPGRALNPSLTIGRQIREVFEIGGRNAADSAAGSRDILRRVRIADPERVLDRYPHQLSGGMQQRVCIAMALVSNPTLLILDEPTTGLDSTIEAEVLDIIAQLRADLGVSILFISHNLAVLARMCDRVGILYGGELVEEGASRDLFDSPRHPYTAALLQCLPRAGQRKDQSRLPTIPGGLPGPGEIVAGCAFAARCGYADSLCLSQPPALRELGDRRTRCHHPDRIAVATNPQASAANAAPAERGPLLLRLDRVSKTYPSTRGAVKALHSVSLDLRVGETLGVVGESGSGKSTLAKAILGLAPHDEGGRIELDSRAVSPDLRRREPLQVNAIQIVFQNPESALNRSHAIDRIIGRALTKLGGLRGAARRVRAASLLESVRVAARFHHVLPRQLSGGLKQRVAVARAFAGEPRVVVCDEPTSALDVSVQAAILNLLADLQAAKSVAYIFISHDLGVVRYIADRIVVLYLGRILELGAAEQIFAGPHHPYTEALLSSAPSLGETTRGRVMLKGEIPSLQERQTGCAFHSRCARKFGPRCETEEPPLREIEPGHALACHLPIEELGRAGA
ncbi:MAG: ABC transporter ATP-binding protein [Pseudomonadota bacterium]|nr:ABC transporter ATP-binding protein [Pseudomonadota bacterium]